MSKIILKGITWGHSRGITPLLAVSQRYMELHPEVEIQWKKRTLQEFADFPIEKLTLDYDLLIIDHPWVGCAAATNCVLPLNKYLDAAYLKNQADNSVGDSHFSYNYEGGQWALAIDAATPVASYRRDLLTDHNKSIPQTWEEVLVLAKMGKVAAPAIPIDLLMNFYTFCIAHGKEPFQTSEEVIDEATGLAALDSMKELYSLVDKRFFQCNPIAVAELMSNTNDYWYCPFAYCYSNYSRSGYSKYILKYTDVVRFGSSRLRTTIGGTGLSVSSSSKHPEVAVDFAAKAVSHEWQQTLYVQNGGQPGHKAAWLDADANRISCDFFKQCLPVMENGYLRPRYNGYLHFQDHGGDPVQQFLLGKLTASNALQQLNKIYRKSFVTSDSKIIA
jgi:multiple sugar transport system substrate-binding protein